MIPDALPAGPPLLTVIADGDTAYGAALRRQLEGRAGNVVVSALVSDPAQLLDAVREKLPQAAILSAEVAGDATQPIAHLRQAGVAKIVVLVPELADPRIPGFRAAGAEVVFRYTLSSELLGLLCSLPPVEVRPAAVPMGQAPPAAPPGPGQAPEVLVVYSPKGGVGKSAIAINLAILYAFKGLRTVLVDFAQFGSISSLLRIPQRGRGLSGVITLLDQDARLSDEGLADYLRPAAAAFPFRGGELPTLLAAPPTKMDQITESAARQILSALGQAGHQMIVVDTSSELSERLLGALGSATRILLVANPDIAAGWCLLQVRDLFKSLLIPRERVALVMNRMRPDAGFHVEEFQSLLGLPLAGALPDRPRQVQSYANRGLPAVFLGDDEIALAYRRLAHTLCPVMDPTELRKSWSWLPRRRPQPVRHRP